MIEKFSHRRWTQQEVETAKNIFIAGREKNVPHKILWDQIGKALKRKPLEIQKKILRLYHQDKQLQQFKQETWSRDKIIDELKKLYLDGKPLNKYNLPDKLRFIITKVVPPSAPSHRSYFDSIDHAIGEAILQCGYYRNDDGSLDLQSPIENLQQALEYIRLGHAKRHNWTLDQVTEILQKLDQHGYPLTIPFLANHYEIYKDVIQINRKLESFKNVIKKFINDGQIKSYPDFICSIAPDYVGYYNKDFTRLRLSTEELRVKKFLDKNNIKYIIPRLSEKIPVGIEGFGNFVPDFVLIDDDGKPTAIVEVFGSIGDRENGDVNQIYNNKTDVKTRFYNAIPGIKFIEIYNNSGKCDLDDNSLMKKFGLITPAEDQNREFIAEMQRVATIKNNTRQLLKKTVVDLNLKLYPEYVDFQPQFQKEIIGNQLVGISSDCIGLLKFAAHDVEKDILIKLTTTLIEALSTLEQYSKQDEIDEKKYLEQLEIIRQVKKSNIACFNAIYKMCKNLYQTKYFQICKNKQECKESTLDQLASKLSSPFGYIRKIVTQEIESRINNCDKNQLASYLTDNNQLVRELAQQKAKNDLEKEGSVKPFLKTSQLNKVAVPLIFDAETSDKPFEIVWRVQNQEGKGPYRSNSELFNKLFELAYKRQDRENLEYQEFNPMPEYDPGFAPEDKIKQIFDKNFYGFKDRQQYERWFDKPSRDLLEQYGFQLVPVQAEKIWDSGKQVIYKPKVWDNKKDKKKVASIGDLNDLIDIQTQDGNWNYDPYMHGMANGMILSKHVVEDDQDECPFLDPPKQWLKDKIGSTEQQITSVAIKIDDKIYILPRPARHNDVIRYLVENGFQPPIKGVQGFITNTGEFVDRKQGKIIATKANQLIKETHPTMLFSEDLWDTPQIKNAEQQNLNPIKRSEVVLLIIKKLQKLSILAQKDPLHWGNWTLEIKKAEPLLYGATDQQLIEALKVLQTEQYSESEIIAKIFSFNVRPNSLEDVIGSTKQQFDQIFEKYGLAIGYNKNHYLLKTSCQNFKFDSLYQIPELSSQVPVLKQIIDHINSQNYKNKYQTEQKLPAEHQKDYAPRSKPWDYDNNFQISKEQNTDGSGTTK